MKIILAAEENCNEDIAKELPLLLGSELYGKKAALIPNAAIGKDRNEIVGTLSREFTKRGMSVSLIDLEKKSHNKVVQALHDADVISISGGLVSRLIDVVDSKGLRKLLLDLMKKKVFLTFSAGTMAMSKTQFIATHFIGEPDPDARGINGFGIVDFEIYPHYESVLHDDILKIIPEGISVWAIGNDDAIVIDGNDTRLVGNPIKLTRSNHGLFAER